MSWGADGLTVRFGHRVALDAVSVAVHPGVVHAVVGGDGAGKSTLLRVLAGAGVDHEGTVRLPEQRRIAYVPTTGGAFRDLTVDENMAFTAATYRVARWRPRAAMLLERAGLAGFPRRLARQLSGGELRKLAASMALLVEPDLLVLDEVTTGVDPVSRMELWRLVAGAAAAGSAVVAATTYLDEAERAGEVVLLHDGRLLSSGPPDAIAAAARGLVVDTDAPGDPANAWRRGRRWREWRPDGEGDGRPPTLEDAAIIHELVARRGA